LPCRALNVARNPKESRQKPRGTALAVTCAGTIFRRLGARGVMTMVFLGSVAAGALSLLSQLQAQQSDKTKSKASAGAAGDTNSIFNQLGLQAGDPASTKSATSSASSKLVHGGLRYLEQYEFRLVRESLAEREVLLAASRRPQRAEVLEEIFRSRRWSSNRRVRRSLALNPYSPPALASAALALLTAPDLREVAADQTISQDVRVQARRLLDNRGESD